MKKVERICKNCGFFDSKNEKCKVIILHEGQKYNLPVSPGDSCHMEALGIDVQQIRFWTENERGERTPWEGIVKMEYPVDFFESE